MKRMLACAMLLAVVSVGCSNASSSDVSLSGTNWKLVGWSISSQHPSSFEITANFDEKMVAGKSAVNQYSGTYELSGDGKITLGPLMSTEMAGSEEDMRAENNYINLLTSVKKFAIENGQLLMTDENGNQLLIFSKAE